MCYKRNGLSVGCFIGFLHPPEKLAKLYGWVGLQKTCIKETSWKLVGLLVCYQCRKDTATTMICKHKE